MRSGNNHICKCQNSRQNSKRISLPILGGLGTEMYTDQKPLNEPTKAVRNGNVSSVRKFIAVQKNYMAIIYFLLLILILGLLLGTST